MQDPVKLESQIDDRLSKQARKRQLWEGLQTLSVKHRTVLELVFFQEMSMQEVAKICEIPLGTVKSRLKYAKDALRAAIHRQESSSEVTQ